MDTSAALLAGGKESRIAALAQARAMRSSDANDLWAEANEMVSGGLSGGDGSF